MRSVSVRLERAGMGVAELLSDAAGRYQMALFTPPSRGWSPTG